MAARASARELGPGAWRRDVGCSPTREECAYRPGRGRNPVRWPAAEKQGAVQLLPLSFPFPLFCVFPLLFVFPFPFPFPLLPLALLLAALVGTVRVLASLVAGLALWPGIFPVSPVLGTGWLAVTLRVGAPPRLCDGPVRVGADLPGVGAPNVLCANRCSGAGSASATAVPHSPATKAAVIPATRTGVFLACGRLSVCFTARVSNGLVASMNASMAAASPDSSR